MAIKNHNKWEEMESDIFIYNKECVCDHGFLHPMKARKGRYIIGNLYYKIK